MPGSVSASRLPIPEADTNLKKPFSRYLLALCGYNVSAGQSVRLLGYRQKLIIGTVFEQGQGNAAVIITKEMPVATPDWAFPDGNVAWCFRFIPGSRQVPRLNAEFNPLNLGPNKTTNPSGAFSALLYRDSSSPIYQPTSSGQPPGFAVEGVSTLYDVRNPWTNPNPITATLLHGPGDIIMYASVMQTDPDTRPVWEPPTGFDLGALVPEDRFVLAFPQTRYRAIAGAMILEVA